MCVSVIKYCVKFIILLYLDDTVHSKGYKRLDAPAPIASLSLLFGPKSSWFFFSYVKAHVPVSSFTSIHHWFFFIIGNVLFLKALYAQLLYYYTFLSRVVIFWSTFCLWCFSCVIFLILQWLSQSGRTCAVVNIIKICVLLLLL